jgi:hypothetical protein
MERHRFANTDLTVSIIGLGCYGMSGAYGPADDAESIATIQGAEDRARVVVQSVAPLIPVQRVPPGVLMRIEIGSCTSGEGHALGCLELLPATVLTPSFDRVDPVKAHPPALGCTFACIS